MPKITIYILLFFFFQAEDGIRDGHVTGVQTCALPIFYLEGCTIRWKTFESSGARRVSLPTYPFQHRDYWMRQPHGPELRAAEPHTADRVDRPHPLLGDRLGDGVRFESVLAVDQRPFLGDHRLFRRIVLPTTAALDTVMAAARNALGFARPLIS